MSGSDWLDSFLSYFFTTTPPTWSDKQLTEHLQKEQSELKQLQLKQNKLFKLLNSRQEK